MKLDIIPSDYVAAVLHWSSRKAPEELPPVLHVCSGPGDAISIGNLVPEVRRIFRKYGRRLPSIKKVPLPLLKTYLRLARPFIPRRHRRAVDALPFFFAYLRQPQVFANARTRELLSADNIDLPKPADYMAPVLFYYLGINDQC